MPCALLQKFRCFADADTILLMKQTPTREGRPARTRDSLPTERRIAGEIERMLAERVPPGWTVRSELPVPADQPAVDLVIEVTSPAGEAALLAVEIKARVEPRRVPELARRIREMTNEGMSGVVPVLGAAYLSPRARELLRGLDVGYIDTTGNVRITASSPGLFISSDGAMTRTPGRVATCCSRYGGAVPPALSGPSSMWLLRSVFAN